MHRQQFHQADVIFPMLKRWILLIACIAGLGCSRERTVWDGIYTSAQAGRGREVYNSYCVDCHTGNLSQIHGQHFIDNWREDSLKPLFDRIKRTMPGNAPRSLSDQQYLDVLSFILQKNDFPAGKKELGVDRLEHVQLVGRNGPQPLPDGALVQAVGCLEKSTDTSWKLTSSTPLVRSRTVLFLTPDDLKVAGKQRRGRENLVLSTKRLRFFRSRSWDLSPLASHRVVVGGNLVRKASDTYIELNTVQELNPNCPQ
jgi:mono/diheme cytochrome c family protein